jgi:hypothetical protein
MTGEIEEKIVDPNTGPHTDTAVADWCWVRSKLPIYVSRVDLVADSGTAWFAQEAPGRQARNFDSTRPLRCYPLSFYTTNSVWILTSKRSRRGEYCVSG